MSAAKASVINPIVALIPSSIGFNRPNLFIKAITAAPIATITTANRNIGLVNKALPNCIKVVPKFLSPAVAPLKLILVVISVKVLAFSEAPSKSRFIKESPTCPSAVPACSNALPPENIAACSLTSFILSLAWPAAEANLTISSLLPACACKSLRALNSCFRVTTDLLAVSYSPIWVSKAALTSLICCSNCS